MKLGNYIIIMLLCLLQNAYGQDVVNYVFKNYSIDQGHINHILRDSEGFIWISTQDGLTKYNGAHWIQYNYNAKDTTSLSHNYVWLTYEDSNGNLWVGTFAGGLCLFNREKEKFSQFSFGEERGTLAIRSMLQYSETDMLVGTDNGLYSFDFVTQKIVIDSFFLEQQKSVGLFHCHHLIQLNERLCIVSGQNGAYIVNTDNWTVKILDIAGISYKGIGPIIKHGAQLLMASESGVHLVSTNDNYESFQTNHFIYVGENPEITTIKGIAENHYLLGANDGLFAIDMIELKATFIPSSDPKVPNGLTDKVVYAIAEVEDNLYWLGTKTLIYELSTTPSNFLNIESSKLCGSAILGMHEDANHNLWLATRKGLARIKGFNLPLMEWEYFCYDYINVIGLRNEYILNVMELRNELWLGYRRSGATRFRVDEYDNLTLIPSPAIVDLYTNDYSVGTMFEDSRKNVWIGTSGNGILKWMPESDSIVQYKKETIVTPKDLHPFAFDFAEMNDGTLSIATADGFGDMNIDTEDLVVYRRTDGSNTSPSGNFVMDFFEDDNGNRWISTDHGINLWNEDNTFKSWTKNEGLPNDVIYGMEGFGGSYWLSTNRGIVNLTYDNVLNPSFKTYSKSDGLINDEYNQFSHYTTKNGRVVFGGKDGVTLFDPRKINLNDIKAKPVIEKFKLFNEDANHLLVKHINYAEEIKLDYNQNFISFELASQSYRDAHNNQFRYRMNELNKDWITLEKRNYLSFNGLNPGNYLLEIQASNNDGIWGSEIRKLRIHIKQPLWNSWYAWLFYFSLIGLSIYIFYRMRLANMRNILLAKESERKEIRERSARDFHDEAGTIITKLSLQSQFLLRRVEKDKEGTIALRQMEDNVQKLRAGMRDFIWVLDPGNDSLKSLARRINIFANDIFEHTEIAFKLKSHISETENIELNGNQRRQLLLIVKESLNNVIKHSGAKFCEINIYETNDQIKITIQDDGVGFDNSALDSGNGLKNLLARAKKIQSELVISSEGKGTLIEINVPVDPNGVL